jgi:GNAT superfamily N-acetyltransferase
MEIKIRKATMKDLRIIQGLNLKLFEKEKKEFDSTLDMDWTFGKQGTSYFKRIIRSGFAAIAEADSKPIGYLAGEVLGPQSYRTLKKIGYLGNMFVLDEYRGRNIGTDLVEAFLAWCKAKGCERIKVEVSAGNKDALRFYKRFDFKDYILVLEKS